MRWIVAALLAAGVSCVDTGRTSETEKERTARESFEAWQEAIMKGDFETFYGGMTFRLRSLWMWYMLQGGNTELMQKKMDELPKGTRVDFDLWRGRNAVRTEERVDLLPLAILRGDWLKETIREHFVLVQKDLAFEFKSVKILRVYVDGTGATVMIKNIKQKKELYNLIWDGEKWKVDGHRASVPGGG